MREMKKMLKNVVDLHFVIEIAFILSIAVLSAVLVLTIGKMEVKSDLDNAGLAVEFFVKSIENEGAFVKSDEANLSSLLTNISPNFELQKLVKHEKAISIHIVYSLQDKFGSEFLRENLYFNVNPRLDDEYIINIPQSHKILSFHKQFHL